MRDAGDLPLILSGRTPTPRAAIHPSNPVRVGGDAAGGDGWAVTGEGVHAQAGEAHEGDEPAGIGPGVFLLVEAPAHPAASGEGAGRLGALGKLDIVHHLPDDARAVRGGAFDLRRVDMVDRDRGAEAARDALDEVGSTCAVRGGVQAGDGGVRREQAGQAVPLLGVDEAAVAGLGLADGVGGGEVVVCGHGGVRV